MNLNFLKSRRFWSLVVIAVLGVLQTEGILPDEIVKALVIILSGFIGIRTIDRFSESVSK